MRIRCVAEKTSQWNIERRMDQKQNYLLLWPMQDLASVHVFCYYLVIFLIGSNYVI